mmetsp:Transcript_46406/g.68538  ORF Transcript_46406/g.68538 Transcript_46406/m.68538 type:complete len:601 (-) Transcript_46406:322-2124(-)
MAITNAERNKRKRERKKREREQRRLEEEKAESLPPATTDESSSLTKKEVEIEVEYVPEALLFATTTDNDDGDDGDGGDEKMTNEGDTGPTGDNDDDDENNIEAMMRRFQSRASVVTSDEDENEKTQDENEDALSKGSGDDDDDDEDQKSMSRRKIRELNRPTVSELKQRVKRADLVEAHDVTSADPDFLVYLKGIPGTVPVPRHWGRKRKYLQGKRGIEKAPFQLPDYISKTGISEIRGAVTQDEAKQSLKQKQRARIAPKSGAIDVDYKTLHDAFFKYQTRPDTLSGFGDLYYEGKEFEQRNGKDFTPGKLSERLREALGMGDNNTTPPPWLIHMQRYGPPPAYPNLKIPGLNAPLPAVGCCYGYHVGGWGKPPVDAFGRGLYGNVFGKPQNEESSSLMDKNDTTPLVTSDGKTLHKSLWGVLPTAEEEESSSEEEDDDDDSSDEEPSGDEEMGVDDDTDAAAETTSDVPASGSESVLPPQPDGIDSVLPTSGLDLRKTNMVGGDETPLQKEPPKQLYTVLETTEAGKKSTDIFTSDVAYLLPGSSGNAAAAATTEEGAESVLSKMGASKDGTNTKKKRARGNGDDEEDLDDLGKKFKF